jgi:hypothetical protein
MADNSFKLNYTGDEINTRLESVTDITERLNSLEGNFPRATLTVIGAGPTPITYDGSQEVEITIPENGIDNDTITEAVENYLEENFNATVIVAPEIAEVGQTIVVEEVDENNKPIAWTAKDWPPIAENYITDTDYATTDRAGLIKVGTNLFMTADHELQVNIANEEELSARDQDALLSA